MARPEERRKKPIMRVPVASVNGQPLMPTTPQRARTLLRAGIAEKRWNKLGQFYIQMRQDIASNRQGLCLAVDTGSKWDGVAVLSTIGVITSSMLVLPLGVAERLDRRRMIRRARRHRKTRRRPQRFDNRRKPEGWLAPSQKAKVDFRIRIVDELCKIYPATQFAVEDVHFNKYKRRWTRHANTAEQGKTMFYRHLRKLGRLTLYDGFETAEFRKSLKLQKNGVKRELTWDTHAIDAIAIGCNDIGCVNPYPQEFWVWRRSQPPRRQLQRIQPRKGGNRVRYGGTWSIPPFKKGDVVQYRGGLARVGGFRDGLISLHNFDLDNERFTTRAKPDECKRLFNQRVFSKYERLQLILPP
ncbi:MAG: RRXRR domain-containing protein [Promethearchaeati archaeon SRVP18_Atabeyarchaeia-1]